MTAEPYIEIGPEGTGRFQFGALQATMDVREAERDGKPSIKFTWEGFEEGDEICGRGWALINGSQLYGHLYFHLGDDYGFRAERIGK